MKTLKYWAICCICLLWKYGISKPFWTVIDLFPYRIYKSQRDDVIECFIELEDKFMEYMGFLPQQISDDDDSDIEF